MAALTMRDLEPLLGQFAGEGPVLSCYAELRASEGFRPDWRGPFEAKAGAIWKAVGEDGRARAELEENLAAVRRALDAPEVHGARWAAVFSATRRGFLATYELDVPTETDLVLDRSPYLVPLLWAIHRRREYLAVHTDTHRGRLYAATPAGARLLDELDEDVPRKQHSAGQLWGTEQATIARHREDRILHYRKELVARVEKEWARGGYAGLLLLGDHETLAHLRGALPPRLAAAVRREAPEPWYERPADVEEAVRTMALDVFTADEAEVAEGFWDLLAEGRAVAAGPRAVLAVLQGGLVGQGGFGYLALGPDPREVVGRCGTCRYLSVEGPGTCPRCGGACGEGSLWEEILLAALKHGVSARYVAGPQKLARYGGVVAVLPRAAAPAAVSG
jgi:hypothetical protein